MSSTDGELFFQNFRNSLGIPYSGVRVYHYVAGGTTTTKNVYTDGGLGSADAQPSVGDSNGWVKFYGDGDYRLLIKTSVADGDLTLFDLDPIKLNEKAATLRPENQAASYPAATNANRGQIAAKTLAGNITELGINKDGSGFSPFQLQSDPYTATVAWAKGADLASASTLTLGTDGNFFDVTGTVGISAISSKPAGTWIRLRFISAAVAITNNATSLRLRNGRDYSSSAGDVLDFVSLGSGNWQEAMGRQNLVGAVLPFENCTITASVATNALTVALKTSSGADPTTADPIRIGFQNNPITTGGYDVVEITAALSMILSAGSTLGFIANQASRIYVGALRTGTSAELFLYHPLSTTSLRGLVESALYSTTAEGGSGGADSAQTLYSTTARASIAIRLIGYLDITTGATPGNWTANPMAIRLLVAGVPRTGDRIQRPYLQTSALATGTTILPDDNSIPQITEGDQYMSLTITPTNTIHRLNIDVGLFGSSGVNVQQYAALFQDATANALMASKAGQGNTLTSTMHRFSWEMAAGTVASTTFRVRAGVGSAGTFTFNGQAGAAWFGGVTNSFLSIEEICL